MATKPTQLGTFGIESNNLKYFMFLHVTFLCVNLCMLALEGRFPKTLKK